MKSDNDEYLASEKNASQSIKFISESARDCNGKPTDWRREGRHFIDNNNNALAVKNLPQKGWPFILTKTREYNLKLTGNLVRSCPMRAEIILSESAKVDKESKDDWKLCASHCADEAECKAWMWNIKSQECSTANEAPTEVDLLVQSFVSGTKDCDGKELNLETVEKDLDSSAQHWTIHLGRISVHGTDLFLENSKSLKTPTYTASSNIFRWNFDPLSNVESVYSSHNEICFI